MKKILISIFALAILLQNSLIASAAFSDVKSNNPYATDINYLESTGIVTGESFKPNRNITREEFAKWVLKNAGFEPESTEATSKWKFRDVPTENNPYAPYIYKLKNLGILDNKITAGKVRTKFFPEEPITRAEALSWMLEVEGIPVPKIFNEKDFKAEDVKTNSVLAPLIYKAIGLEILPPGKVYPEKTLKRSEAAHYIKTVSESRNTLTVTILQPVAQSDMMQNQKFDVLTGAWNRILQKYLKKDKVNKDDLIYGAIEGMVDELGDKHSTFERPGDNAILDSLSGEVEGIGTVIQKKDEYVEIVAPIAGSPAEKAGLLPNDIIIAVDETSIKGMKLGDVANKIKGKKGTQVILTIKRGDRTLIITVTRDIVKVASVTLSYTSDNFAEIQLNNFGENTGSEFATIVADIEAKKPAGIILDLRNDPGGFLNTAIQIAGFFVKSPDKVSIVRYPDREETYNSSGKAELSKYKIVVLINKGSASASEILAGALKDYGLATIVGETSFGKGTVQELSDFSDGSTLKITVAEWLTPTGHSIEGNGIKPDIEVKLTEEDRLAKRDPQMDRALGELRK